MVNPSIVAGVYTPEEVSDFDDNKSTPAQSRSPLRGKATAEPKEADARVVDPPAQAAESLLPAPAEQPAPSSEPATDDNSRAEAALAMHEETVNAYLVHLKLVPANKTWRDLSGIAKCKAMATPSKLIAQAKSWATEQKGAGNVA